MSDIMNTGAEEFRGNPCLWISVAREMAETPGTVPPASIGEILASANRPVIDSPQSCRKEFWALLSQSHRHLGIEWLHETGILQELIPCWGGNEVRQQLRLQALEQVHQESWKEGLSEAAFNQICTVHDVVVDRRLNRWALTALGTLLAGGDTENQKSWARQVRVDLHTLGATEAELVWIDRIVFDFNASILFLKGLNDGFDLRPEHAVAALSTLHISEPELVGQAVERVNAALEAKS